MQSNNNIFFNQMREIPVHSRGSQVPNHISVYILGTNFQFILNCAPVVCRTCNATLNWLIKSQIKFLIVRLKLDIDANSILKICK